MPKKKPSSRRYRRHTIERGVEDFGKEMERLGERASRSHVKHDIFGPVGPLLSGIFGIFLLVLVVWFVNLINSFFGLEIISSLTSFMIRNVGYFFLIFIFFGYASYFSGKFRSLFFILEPIVLGFSFAIAFWLASKAMFFANLTIGNPDISRMEMLFRTNLVPIFFAGFFIGILASTLKILKKSDLSSRSEGVFMSRNAESQGKIKRLYRSGKERILGGVCGGIAEYLGTDPVLIRLLWAAACLLWGTGILLYLIAWIIIPKNPKDRWD